MTKLKRQWIIGFAGASLIVVMTAFSSVAEACHGCMMHGQAQSGHDQHDQGEPDDHSANYLKHLIKHAKEIGLTPEQIGKLKAMQLDFERADVRLDGDIKVAKLELHALLEDEQADLSAIQAKVDQLKKAEGAHVIAAIKSKRNAMAMLTPDQREKDRAHREHMQHEGQGQHGGGMGHGGMMGGGHGGGSGGDHGGSGVSGGQQHQH